MADHPSSAVHLPSALMAQIDELARAAWPEECCGLLIGGKGDGAGPACENAHHVTRIVAARNIAPQPLRTFEIDPAALFDAHRTARQHGQDVIGCFHSHPNGVVAPSQTDLSRAEQAGFFWLIIATTAQGVAARQLYRRMPIRDDAEIRPGSGDMSVLSDAVQSGPGWDDGRYFQPWKLSLTGA